MGVAGAGAGAGLTWVSLGLPAWTPVVLRTVTNGGGLEAAATQDGLGPHPLTW